MSSPSASRPCILVVEDDPGAGQEVSAALEDYGFEVECVPTGFQGLLRATNGEFDAVVLDRMLPDVDGLSILATLRNIGKETPVLILSALDAVDERVRGLRAGGDDYVVKPFDGLELTARVNALLRRRAATHGDTKTSVLQIDDLTLDTETQVVMRGDRTIELKPREYGMLEMLMRHAGEIVTRAMLLESVWNVQQASTQTNVIDMHISNLRRKLSLNGQLSAMVVTVRNAGYIIHASR